MAELTMKDPAPEAPTFPPGLIRLSIQSLPTLKLTHLASGIHDEPTPLGPKLCGRPTKITGYTEWIDARGSPLTLGWDWEIRCAPGQACWQRLGLPFTNLLLVNDDRLDLPWQRSLQYLAQWVDALAWAEATRAALRFR